MNQNIENAINLLNTRVMINQADEIAPEYTLVVRPTTEISDKIESLNSELAKLDDNHFYYASQNLHATIYGRIDINANIERLHAFLSNELKNMEMIFSVEGLLKMAVIAEPVDFSLLDFRKKMVNFLQDFERLSRRETVLEQVSWITFLRFTANPNEQLIEYLEGNRSKSFGLFKPESIELYKTNKRIIDESTEKIFAIRL